MAEVIEGEKNKQTNALLQKDDELTTLSKNLTQKDKLILGFLFFIAALLLILLCTLPQASLQLTFQKAPEGDLFSDQTDDFGVSGLLEWCKDGDSLLVWILVFFVVAIIPPSVFIMYGLIIFYPMKKSTREWLEFIAMHNARGMFSYTFSFYIAYDGITVDCDYKGITLSHIQGAAESGIVMVFLYTSVMCALGTYIHFLYYEHNNYIKRDGYSPILAFSALLFLFIGFSVPFGESDFRGYLSSYCNEGEDFVWFSFVSSYAENDYYTDWWRFWITFSFLVFFVLIPILNVVLLCAISLYPGNYKIYVPQFILTQFYPVDYCVLKYFLVAFEYHKVIKAMIDDRYEALCDVIGGFEGADESEECFTEHWLYRRGLLILTIHVMCYWGTEYSMYSNKIKQSSNEDHVEQIEYSTTRSVDKGGNR